MRICLAPMDGITDCAYRVICKQVFEQYGHPNDQLMLWTEFMSADGYCHNPPGVIKHLLKTDYEPELIAQIFGGEGDTLLSCAVDIEAKYNFAGIELNMGCPSPKIMRCAAGSGMLKDKANTLRILQQMHKALSLPLSLKTRIGLTKNDINEQFDFLVAASQYVRLIAIHGRTYKQSHSGLVDREFIYKIKERCPETVVIGNGGLRSYQESRRKCRNLDGNMIAQSAIGNPWILTPHTPSIHEKYKIITDHLQLMCAAESYFIQAVDKYDQEQKLLMPTLAQLKQIARKLSDQSQTASLRSPIEFRKYLFNYVSGLPGNKALKKKIPQAKEYGHLLCLIDEYFSSLLTNEERETQ